VNVDFREKLGKFVWTDHLHLFLALSTRELLPHLMQGCRMGSYENIVTELARIISKPFGLHVLAKIVKLQLLTE
jgi:hypothetical protein